MAMECEQWRSLEPFEKLTVPDSSNQLAIDPERWKVMLEIENCNLSPLTAQDFQRTQPELVHTRNVVAN